MNRGRQSCQPSAGLSCCGRASGCLPIPCAGAAAALQLPVEEREGDVVRDPDDRSRSGRAPAEFVSGPPWTRSEISSTVAQRGANGEHGKEGVDGSSPSEGFSFLPAYASLSFSG